ncbi:STAS domain-containing protein [Fulvimarina sp. MAC3]|uniref:STAS domain-containing protein n=1 Tax=Fulvimarina sp. MAC3 TaxID=3148887 RepID=UPI0031FE130A
MITTTMFGDLTVARLDHPRLIAANAPNFRKDVLDLVDQGHSRLVVDLSGVSFIDSTGLGALVALFKHIGMRGDLAIAGLTPPVAQMFKLTRMDRVFRIYRTVEESLDGLKAA